MEDRSFPHIPTLFQDEITISAHYVEPVTSITANDVLQWVLWIFVGIIVLQVLSSLLGFTREDGDEADGYSECGDCPTDFHFLSLASDGQLARNRVSALADPALITAPRLTYMSAAEASDALRQWSPASAIDLTSYFRASHLFTDSGPSYSSGQSAPPTPPVPIPALYTPPGPVPDLPHTAGQWVSLGVLTLGNLAEKHDRIFLLVSISGETEQAVVTVTLNEAGPLVEHAGGIVARSTTLLGNMATVGLPGFINPEKGGLQLTLYIKHNHDVKLTGSVTVSAVIVGRATNNH